MKYGIVETPLEQESAEQSRYAMAPTTLGRAQPQIEFNPLKSASLGTIAGGSFIDDRDVLLGHYAKARFPDDPNAVERYGISDEGIIYYVADDGKAYAEIPNDYSLESMAKQAASGISKAIPFTTGTGVGIASAPLLMTGPLGAMISMGLTSAAAGAGEGIRQWIGNAFGDPVDTGDAASEAAWAAGGQGVAGVAGRFANRHMARDLARMDVPASNQLGNQANAFGIRLSPAEQTNLRTLGAKEKILRELPDSANIMDDFKMGQQGDVSRAANAFMNRLSPIDDALPAGQMAKEAAGNAMSRITAQRAAQARPFYLKAFKEAPPVNIEPVIQHIDDQIAALKGKGGIAAKLKQVRDLLTDGKFAEDSLEVLHNRKMEIDDIIEKSPANSIGKNAKRHVVDVQKRLLEAMDAASPDYAKGRSIYKDLSPGVDAVNEGIVGAIANLNDKTLEKAASMMFSNRGPQSVRNARNLISKESPEAWNALLRNFLQREFVQAGKEFSTTRGVTNQGAKFAMRVMGTEAQRDVMKAAMSDSQWAVFKPLVEVLQATGRTAATNSDTAFKQLALEEMKRDGGGLVTKAGRWIGSGVSTNPLQLMREYAEGVAIGRYSEDLAMRFTQPGAVNRLKELTKLPPNSLRARVIVAQFLGLSGKSVDLAPSVGVEPTISNPLQAPSVGQ